MSELTYSCEEPDGEHLFPEAVIGEDDDPPGVLRRGMRIVLPCATCGMPPLEQMDGLGAQLEEKEQALAKLLAAKQMPLFHWAPRARRKQITRYGLRPRMRPNVCLGEDFRLNEICLATDPEMAWLLSGGPRHAPPGVWDLWQTYSQHLHEPNVLGSYDNTYGIHEVRTAHRIYKRFVWHVGFRWS